MMVHSARRLTVMAALLPAVAAFWGRIPHEGGSRAAPSGATVHKRHGAACAALRELPAVILPSAEALKPGERRVMFFSDKSEKRALKQVMKGGAQGTDGKVIPTARRQNGVNFNVSGCVYVHVKCAC